MKIAIIIPTKIEPCVPEDLSDSPGLKLTRRVLTSLKVLRDQDYCLILSFSQTLGPDSQSGPEPAAMEVELRRLIKPLVEKKESWLISNQGLSELKQDPRLYPQRHSFLNRLSLEGYGATRNVGLILALLSGVPAVFFLDNDTVVESPDLLLHIKNVLSEKDRRTPIGGVGGFYIRPDGEIRIPSKRPWWAWCWDKIKSMNEAISLAEAAPGLYDSSMVFGGNLALKKELFSQVPFDPWLPRGEDMDYRINALTAGFDLLFNPEQRVRHLPPERDHIYRTHEFIGDVKRFLYERTKARGIDSSRLQPYPGAFMGPGLRIRSGLTLASFIIWSWLQGHPKSAAKAATAAKDLFRGFTPQVEAYRKMSREWAAFARSLPSEGRPEIIEKYSLNADESLSGK